MAFMMSYGWKDEEVGGVSHAVNIQEKCHAVNIQARYGGFLYVNAKEQEDTMKDEESTDEAVKNRRRLSNNR